jgi:hypothetical protein
MTGHLAISMPVLLVGAGLNVVEVLLSVNGQPIQEIEMPALGALIRRIAPLQTEVKDKKPARLVNIH